MTEWYFSAVFVQLAKKHRRAELQKKKHERKMEAQRELLEEMVREKDGTIEEVSRRKAAQLRKKTKQAKLRAQRAEDKRRRKLRLAEAEREETMLQLQVRTQCLLVSSLEVFVFGADGYGNITHVMCCGSGQGTTSRVCETRTSASSTSALTPTVKTVEAEAHDRAIDGAMAEWRQKGRSQCSTMLNHKWTVFILTHVLDRTVFLL